MIASNYSNKVDDIIVMMKWINNNKNKMMEWAVVYLENIPLYEVQMFSTLVQFIASHNTQMLRRTPCGAATRSCSQYWQRSGINLKKSRP